jgi:ribose transport system substrate-binding protein
MTARIGARIIIHAACIGALAVTGSVASASPNKPVIALSNAYCGNAWRHQMAQAFEEAAKRAKADGQIADYIVLNGDGTVSQQNSRPAPWCSAGR